MNWTPQRKIGAGLGVGMPVAVIAAWMLKVQGIEMPAEVSVALGSVITTLVAYLVPQ